MSRILLADDSPHAQRMGERILREEGYEVVTVTDGQTALMRLQDVDPDIVFADVSLPGKSGYEICREIKTHPRHRHVRVILTAGLLESFDDEQATTVKCDGILKKPFEASVVLDTVRPLMQAAENDRAQAGPLQPLELALPRARRHQPVSVTVVSDETGLSASTNASALEVERVRAAVTLALDAALPTMIDKITERVLIALGH